MNEVPMPIIIDENICLDGCTICDFFCPGDIIYRLEKDKPPEVAYPDECWYCGACVLHCPVDAISIIFPQQMLSCETSVKELVTGVVFEKQDLG